MRWNPAIDGRPPVVACVAGGIIAAMNPQREEKHSDRPTSEHVDERRVPDVFRETDIETVLDSMVAAMDSRCREKFSDRPAFKHVDERRVLDVFRKADVKTVLDVGCGVGNTVARLVEWGFDAFGVTINDDEIAASSVAARLQLADIQAPLEHFRKPFDAVVCLDCLEHLESPLAGLRQINRALKSGGLLIAYIPPVRWTECDYHIIVYTPRQMRWLLNLTGFRLQHKQGSFWRKGITYYCVKESAGQLERGRMA